MDVSLIVLSAKRAEGATEDAARGAESAQLAHLIEKELQEFLVHSCLGRI